MKSLNILKKFKKENLKLEPYPYIVINDALDKAPFNWLESSYPSIETLASYTELASGKEIKNNQRYQISAQQGLSSPDIPDIWKDFIEYHTSKDFFDEVMNIFNVDVFADWSLGLRNRDGKAVGTDCQIGLNSPVTEKSTVIGPHVDNPKEIYAGLFYMRDKMDNSEGGSFNVLKPKSYDIPVKKNYPKYKDSMFEVKDTIPYRRNTFVLLLCTKYAFHGVTKRSVTSFSRKLVNIIAEVKKGKWYDRV